MQIKYIHFYWFSLIVMITLFGYNLFASLDVNNAPVSDVEVKEVEIPKTTVEMVTEPLISNLIYDSTTTDTDNNSDTSSNPSIVQQRKYERPDIGVQKSKQVLESAIRITQTESEHVKQRNGSMYAIDLVTPSGDAYFPDNYNSYAIYYIGEDSRIGNYIIIRHNKERWVYGHTQTTRQSGDSIHTEKDGKVLGQYNKSGISNAPHAHIERWTCPDKESKMKDCQNVSSEGTVAPRNRQLIEQRGWEEKEVKHDTEALRGVDINVGTKGNCTANAAVEEINYAYQLGGIDFVGTIAAESKFDPASNGDKGKSFGYCQIHSTWNKATQMDYRKLTTNKEKLDFCYKIYKGYLDKGNIHRRLYGYNVRYTKGLPKLNIKCN